MIKYAKFTDATNGAEIELRPNKVMAKKQVVTETGSFTAIYLDGGFKFLVAQSLPEVNYLLNHPEV